MQKRAEDPGNKGEADGWQNAGLDLSSWEKVKVPSGWFTDKNVYGAVWYRRDIEVPAGWAGKDLVLNLGVIDDFDTAYFNEALKSPSADDLKTIAEFLAGCERREVLPMAYAVFNRLPPEGSKPYRAMLQQAKLDELRLLSED